MTVILRGAPILLLMTWVAKLWSPDLSEKGLLMARDLEVSLEITGSGAALWQQLMLPAFAAACLIYIIRSRGMFARYMVILLPLLLLVGYLIVSTLWSDSAGDTMRRAARQLFLFTAVAGAVVISRSNNRYVTYLQFFSVLLLIAESLFLLMPSISFDPYNNFTGLHKNKNEFGGVAGVCLLITVCVLRYYAESSFEKRVAIAATIGWSILLVLSASKTPIGLVLFLLPFLLIHPKYLKLVSLGVVAMWLFIIAIFPLMMMGFGEPPIDFYRSILPEDALTGRTGIWYHLLYDMKKSWMFGTSYGAYWGVGAVPEALDIKWSYYRLLHTGHSGFIDLCMELGVIPTVMWLLGLGVFIVMLGHATDALSGVLLAFALLHNCLETSFLHGMHFVWVVMLVAMFNIFYTNTKKTSFASSFRQIRKRHRPFTMSAGTSSA